MTHLAIWLLALGAASIATQGRPALQGEGCYRFDRPLGHSASGNVERSDSTWYTVELQAGGVVARPRLQSSYWRDEYARGSSWRTRGDTLVLRVATSLVGWEVTLVPTGPQYAGRARYLTDVVVANAAPRYVRVRAVREACPRRPSA